METSTRKGGRRVELFMPIEDPLSGKAIEAIEFAPFRLQHTRGWERGAYATPYAFAAALAGVEEHVLDLLIYPDVERVLDVFLQHCPKHIREALGTWTGEEAVRQPEMPEAAPGPTVGPGGPIVWGDEGPPPELQFSGGPPDGQAPGEGFDLAR